MKSRLADRHCLWSVGVYTSWVKKLNSNTLLMRAKVWCVSVLYAVVRFMHVQHACIANGQIHICAHLHLRLSRNFLSRSVSWSHSHWRTELQIRWLGHHCTEELLMGEDRSMGVCATLSPRTWQLVARLLWMALGRVS